MLFIDSVSFEGDLGQAWTTVKDDWLILDENNQLSGAAFFEIMAQGFAAISAVQATNEQPAYERPKAGFLVGVKKLSCHKKAKPGDELRITLGNTMSIGPFHVFDAFIHGVAGELVASGQIKVFLAKADDLQGAFQDA
jgi:predicted hotdog family 3-hydroxylacyl-ACP dehydratase